MYKRWNIKKIALWIFFIMQITLILLYWITQNENSFKNTTPNLKNPVVFIKTNLNVTKNKRKYFDENSRIVLKTKNVEELFENFNTSLCYKYGTDLKQMKRSKVSKWKCLCEAGWHGNDCGQPEVIWRALLASRKRPIIPSTRKLQRRLLYFIEINIITAKFNEINFYELKNVVDLFLICDISNLTNIEINLNEISDKILYIKGANRNEIWKKTKKIISNLNDDDIFFINNPYEIPNLRALQFLKLYDKWPEPLAFRLRWSVYGFFWKHPQKTILSSGACTLKYLYEALNNNVNLLKTISNDRPSFIIGDLNHFGGWFCEFCNEPSLLIKSLKYKLINDSIIENISRTKIDISYIEDLIENGVYLDGRTQLERAHRFSEQYYAPIIVSNNSWKFDWLLINLYSKMDYY